MINSSSSTLHLSVNSRLSQFLKTYLIKNQLESSAVCLTPTVMTWQQVLKDCQEQQLLMGKIAISDLPKKVLSSFEAQLVWESLLIKADVSALLNITDMAKKLFQAWIYFNEYLEDSLLEENFKTEEISLFLSLKEKYYRFLKQNNYWDSALQSQRQLVWFKKTNPPFKQICLHGFDEITPHLQQGLDSLSERGVEVIVVEQFESAEKNQPQLYSAASLIDEAQQAARWAFALSQASNDKTTKNNIAIVAPNIEEVHQQLTWALDECMFSQQGYPLQSFQKNWQGNPLYNVSLGQPLSNFVLVKQGLLMLKVLLSEQQKLDYESFSNWLTSPYTNGDSLTRQKVDYEIRRWQWAKVSIEKLIEKLQADDVYIELPKQLYKNLVSSLKITRGGKQVSSYQFTQWLLNTLSSMQWASKVGNRSLTSHEFQQKEAFLSALDVFKNQHFPKQTQTAVQWLKLLERFLGELIFQPKNVGESPINIMGMLEAGGQQFDAIWIMGMTGEAWAREANPNPFLPMNLQREYKIPRADASRELTYAQTLTKRLAQSAPTVVFSYANMIEGREQIVSPILNRFKKELLAFQPTTYLTLAEQSLANAKPIEKHLDNLAPPIIEGTEVRGGSGFIAAQAVCPLMAFFDYRLAAKNQLENVEEGVQKNHLGTLIHCILEKFWQAVKTQSKLLELAEKIEPILEKIIVEELEQVKESYQPHFLKLEQKRLFGLVLDWLELEKIRPNFEVVGFEKDYQLEIAGLKFKTKLDRIDKINGEHYILDYKTGSATINVLTKDPIQKPQLAVYLHAPIKDVAGLGYALVYSDDKVKFSSLSREEGIMLKDRSQLDFEKLSANEKSIYFECDWQEGISYLKQQITDLATDIKNGKAELRYQKEDDLKYVGCLLALRLPESKI